MILLCGINRFTCSLIYYSLALNTGSLHGDIYLNTFISGAVEIPAYILGIVMMDMKCFGRRGTGGLSLVGAGLVSFVCIALILNGENTWWTLLWNVQINNNEGSLEDIQNRMDFVDIACMFALCSWLLEHNGSSMVCRYISTRNFVHIHRCDAFLASTRCWIINTSQKHKI